MTLQNRKGEGGNGGICTVQVIRSVKRWLQRSCEKKQYSSIFEYNASKAVKLNVARRDFNNDVYDFNNDVYSKQKSTQTNLR